MRKLNSLDFTTHEQVANWYDAKFTEMGGSWYVPPDELNDLLDRMGYPRDSSSVYLLELGCGDGKLLYEASKRGGWCAGIDISPVAKKMADEKCIGLPVDVRLAAMEEIPWPDATFDYAISYGSLEHCLDIPKAIKEVSRVLKSGGRWLNYAPNSEWLHEDQPLETTMDPEEWQPIYDNAGLTVESITKNGDNTIYVGIK